MLFQENYNNSLKKIIDDYSIKPDDIILEAFQFAYNAHMNQKRKSGEPYIIHPLSVFEILVKEFGLKDPYILVASLLHDCVEDSPKVTKSHIAKQFGEDIALLVDGCTKMIKTNLSKKSRTELTHKKIFLTASREIGVMIIKLADRLHNIRTLDSLENSQKKHTIAEETVEVYAPMAAKLNLFPLKRELYGKAIPYLEQCRKEIPKIRKFIAEIYKSKDTSEVNSLIEEELKAICIPFKVRPRPKDLGAYYSHKKKTININNAENQIDFTIVLDTTDILNCYKVLGLINKAFIPVPKSIRDYIANPKPNGYKSLHCRVTYKKYSYLIKIRTNDMDRWANYGFLQYWIMDKNSDKSYWVEIIDTLASLGEYKASGTQIRTTLQTSEEEMFVYSPKRDIFYLPKGSIVLDFAYKIHSEIGNKCEYAIVNGQKVKYSTQLKDGDTVLIIKTDADLDVDSSLESLCRTVKAKAAVNRKLQKKLKEYATQIGKALLINELNMQGHVVFEEIINSEDFSNFLNYYQMSDASQFFMRIGQDLISPKILNFYINGTNKKKDQKKNNEIQPYSILISQIEKGVHKFSQCCNPFPGEKNLIATLSERGVSFHKDKCQDLFNRYNLTNHNLVHIKWNYEIKWKAPLIFDIIIKNASMNSIFKAISQLNETIQIHKIEKLVKNVKSETARIIVEFENFMDSSLFLNSFDSESISIEQYGRIQLE
ncbi:MAG: bifunctional (p)ppGpp synthetase/guanosine-3',5'-bis(diphosphate) 3'-pyrophosphohydrolase [Desulfobacterales bacterium]|nr:bifunctional (p)ppGpp synthetase/guanosine-3',5'-bis(diphosphate) 3'-pyrophosphohydrolase [Desulfobacterales bacterium]